VSAALAPFVKRVIAVDESAAMLKTARQRVHELPNVDFRSGTLEHPPVAAAELDAALLVLVLHHTADPLRVLTAARGTLKPGGKLLIVDMLPHDQVAYREQMGHQWLGFSESELQGWLADARFDRGRLVALPGDPSAKGPSLFACTAVAAG
jgi:ArsR family transcriptional regulator